MGLRVPGVAHFGEHAIEIAEECQRDALESDLTGAERMDARGLAADGELGAVRGGAAKDDLALQPPQALLQAAREIANVPFELRRFAVRNVALEDLSHPT